MCRGFASFWIATALSGAMPTTFAAHQADGPRASRLAEHQAGGGGELPDAGQLIERAIEVAGGREALESIDSITAKLTQFTEAGAVSMELVRDRAGRFRLKQFVPGMGPIEIGFDGRIGWVNGAVTGGYQILDESALAVSSRQVGLHFLLLELDRRFESLESVGREPFGGEESVRVKLAAPSGSEEFALFDVETGRLLGVEGIERGVAVKRHFDGWKELGGVELFTKMHVKRLNTEWTVEFTDIQINTADPASLD
jgi:hypothetical protein